jgi:F-type H+-transporting ATPase subunit a
MPEGWTWLTFLLEYVRKTLVHNVDLIGQTFVLQQAATWHNFEPIITAILVGLVLILIGFYMRGRLSNVEEAVIPEDHLTLRTFMETFLGYFYDLARDVMGPERAKKYFGLIGASACFVFFANVVALIPGMPVATSSLSITWGSAAVVFILFNLYGIKQNGLGYFKHMAAGPWWLAWFIFLVEIISLIVRPITLAVRLMLNMAVDHLLVAIFLLIFPIIVPLPAMVLTIVVVTVQTLVFTLLTTIYIGLATEHEEAH